MLIAQAMAEYGGFQIVFSAFQQTWTATLDYARSLDGTTWAGALFAAFLVWYAMSRR